MIQLYYKVAVAFMLAAAILFAGGCNRTEVKGASSAVTDRRAIEERPANPYLGTPSVPDLISVSDIMARDLVMTAAVQTAKAPLVIEIKPIENKTGEQMDLTIFPQTIRGFINKQGVRNIVFRDEQARTHIVNERVNQSSAGVLIQDKTETRSKVNSQPGNPKFGGVGTLPPETIEEKEVKRTEKRNVEVGTQIADTDYFLNGFIYATNEMNVGEKTRGYRYFQYQFRLTNARNGLVVWENMYQVKREGVVQAQPN